MKTLSQTLFFFLLVTQISFAQWYEQNSGTTQSLHAVHFIDANNGWAVGDSGTILKTTNSGVTWLNQNSGTNRTLIDVQFKNINLGWAVGGTVEFNNQDSAIILKTTDGGFNWVRSLSIEGKSYIEVCFVNENFGYVAGYGGTDIFGHPQGILSWTDDSGTNWGHEYGQGLWFNSIDFVDDNIGWLVAVSGASEFFWSIIKKTTDGGINWVEQGVLNGINKISCYDSSFVVAAGYPGWCDKGFIYKSSNGGIDWIEVFGPGIYTDVSISSANVVTVVGSDSNYSESGILRSIDSGNTFSFQPIDSVGLLNGVSFVDDYVGWAVGQNGLILHTTNGGVSFVEEEEIDEAPTEFLLSQNFPNPFNPSTKISWQSPVASQQNLIIYDVLGNKITTLVDEYRPAGRYELEFNAVNLPSGVYFCQLKAGEYVNTKKMILIK